MVQTPLIILTRNEAQGLRAILPKIPYHAVSEVLAVDYRSTDGTLELFRTHNIPVIHQKKAGRGEAFRIAADRAKGDYLLFFSPDGNEDPNDIPTLITKMNEGYDMVIASRFMKGAHNEEDEQLLKLRKWANQAFTWIANTLWRGSVTDSINGYRIIHKNAFHTLQLDGDGYVIEYQMTIQALKQKLKIAEIPTYESPRLAGESGSWAIPTGLQFVIQLIKEVLRK